MANSKLNAKKKSVKWKIIKIIVNALKARHTFLIPYWIMFMLRSVPIMSYSLINILLL